MAMLRLCAADMFLLLAVIISTVKEGQSLCDISPVPIKLTTWTGSLHSPGLGKGGYPDGQECIWLIRVTNGSQLRLNFTSFNLVPTKGRDPITGQLNHCSDYVKIEDDVDGVLFYECAITKETVVTSTSNAVTVTFKSDESDTAPGFELEYTGVCGRELTSSGEEVTVETPAFPEAPPDNVTCAWHVQTGATKFVIVRPSPSNASSDLPLCGASPLMAALDSLPGDSRGLCRTDSIFGARGDFTLLYNASAGREAWGGSLLLQFRNESSCTELCMHTSSCDMSADFDYSCTCKEGWVGRNCEARATCSDGPCYNGTCIITPNDGFRCNCNEGFTGLYCEVATAIDYCSAPTDLCLNGTCFNGPGSFKCECFTGFTGNRCESALPCRSNPCGANATCVDLQHDFHCLCPPSYTGDLCEINLDACADSPCQNNGTCSRQGDSFLCQCQAGFQGDKCQEPEDRCLSKPCQHGATCLDLRHTFRCHCPPEYTGTLCHIHRDLPHCLSEEDGVFGSGLHWAATLGGTADVQPCPPGILGQARRFCLEDGHSATAARWTRPDLSDCVSPAMTQLFRQASAELHVPGVVSGQAVLNVTSRLANVTAVVHDGTRVRLYPGDLALAATVAEVVAESLTRVDFQQSQLDALPESYGTAVDNLVDPATHDIWQNALSSLVESRLIDLVAATETFASNYVTNTASGTGRQVADETVTSLSNGDVSPSTDDEVTSSSPSRAGSTPSHNDASQTLLQVAARNVEFQVMRISSRPASPVSLALDSSNSSSISLPQTVQDIVTTGEPGRAVTVFFARFTSMAFLLSLKESRYNGGNSSDGRLINSDVISGSVLGLPEHAFSNLNEPVVLTFALKNTSIADKTKFCVFMNMSASEAVDRWLNTDCVLKEANQSHVTCHCYHLTNFALLMDVFGTAAEFGETNNAVLSYISYIGGSLSLLACIATIVAFEYFRLKSDRIRIHENLALSIILVQAVFLIGVGRTENKTATPEWACKTVAILLHFSLTAMFCWMLVEGIHLYLALVRVFKRGSHLKKFLLIGWGVPLIVVGISVGAFYQMYGQGRICWLNRETLLVSFIPTVGLVILINVVILVIVIRVMMRSMHSRSKVNVQEVNSIRLTLKAALVLLPLLGLTWVLGFLAVDVGGGNLVLAYVFTYAFCISNSFQGVVFFVFHCLLNVDVHTAFERRYRRKKALSSLDTTTSRLRKASDHEPFDISSSRPQSTVSTHTIMSAVDSENSSPYRSLDCSPSRVPESDSYRNSLSAPYQDSSHPIRHQVAVAEFEAISDPGSPTSRHAAFQNGVGSGSVLRRHVSYEDSEIVRSAPPSRQLSGGSTSGVSLHRHSGHEPSSAPGSPSARQTVSFADDIVDDERWTWEVGESTGEATDDVYIADPAFQAGSAKTFQEAEDGGAFPSEGGAFDFSHNFAYTGPGYKSPGEGPDDLDMTVTNGHLSSTPNSPSHSSVESSLSSQPRPRKTSVRFK